jgi:hypothetical protein
MVLIAYSGFIFCTILALSALTGAIKEYSNDKVWAFVNLCLVFSSGWLGYEFLVGSITSIPAFLCMMFASILSSIRLAGQKYLSGNSVLQLKSGLGLIDMCACLALIGLSFGTSNHIAIEIIGVVSSFIAVVCKDILKSKYKLFNVTQMLSGLALVYISLTATPITTLNLILFAIGISQVAIAWSDADVRFTDTKPV